MRAGKLKVYRDRKGEWRWSLASPYNGKCIADGAEGYKTAQACRKGFAAVARYSGTAVES